MTSPTFETSPVANISTIFRITASALSIAQGPIIQLCEVASHAVSSAAKR